MRHLQRAIVESKPQNLIEKLKSHIIELTTQNKDLQLVKDELEIAAKKLHLFCDISTVGYYVIDITEKIVEFNSSGLALLGKTADELLNFTFSQFITKKNLPDFKDFLLKARETDAENFCNLELTINQDKHLIVDLTVRFLVNEQQYLIAAHEKTERKLAKNIFLEKESIFKEIQRIGNIGSFKFNITTNFLELSQELHSIFGLQDSITLNSIESWLDVLHPQDKRMMEEYLIECIVNRSLFRKEYRIIRKNDAEIRWVDGWGETIFDYETNELSMTGVIQDITDRKLAFEKIQNAETRSHRIFESSKEGILILDAITGQITDANPFLIELLGFKYDELVGKELWEIGVFKNIAASKEAFIELQNKEYIRFEDMPLETKAGYSIDVEFVSSVYIVDKNKVILCHIRDISDRKKVDLALKERSQLYFAMFEKNQTPQLLIDPVSGNIIDVNLAAAQFYGYSLEEFKLMTLSDISTFPSDQLLEEMEKFTITGPSYFQFIHKLVSGETCDIEMYTSPLSINGQALLISTINDISKRKLEEERLVQLNFKLNEVNVLKSQFISTVSHEFRTPLAGILSSVQLLQIYNDIWDKDKKEKLFKQIFDAVQHTKALLDDVSLIDEEQTSKTFFRPTNMQLLPLLNEIIVENIRISETNQKVILKSNLDINNYYMDSIMIRHIFNNIISNALKYSNKNIFFELNEIENEEIEFTIKDKGIGIRNEEIKYLFDPFYRASNRGAVQGTGFGLSCVKRFVDLHNGKMLIESVLYKGTVVTITLPYLQK
jgi:PAS domain S-box-containing protein